jgi:hypothetical protein
MNKTAAVVDAVSNIVISIIMADAEHDPAPEGCFLIDVTNTPCAVGWIYDPATGTFTDPNPPQSEE